MAYVCMQCHETYNNKELLYCPKTSCSGEIVEIDDLMLPTIMILNKKGYGTEFCCSGHSYEKCCHPYISFDLRLNKMLKQLKIEIKDNLFKELPEPWYIDDNNKWVITTDKDVLDKLVFRCDIENEDVIGRYKSICDANLRLLNFANNLPSLYNRELYNDEDNYTWYLF